MSSPVYLQLFRDGVLLKEQSLQETQSITIGRRNTDFVIQDDLAISRQHALIHLQGDQILLTDTSRNGVFINGQKVTQGVAYELDELSEVRLAKTAYTVRVRSAMPASQTVVQSTNGEITKRSIEERANTNNPTMLTTPPTAKTDSSATRIFIGGKQQASTDSIKELLQQRNQIVIGRSSDADIRLNSMAVSRRHATLKKQGNEIFIEDQSTNGTLVNGRQIHQQQKIDLNSVIDIGPFRFSIANGIVDIQNSNTPAIEAQNIFKRYSNGYVGLNPMSLSIPTGKFVALMGPSGCGKSTLMKCLNGVNPPTDGAVYLSGLALNQENFNLLKRRIGYVPQEDIIHKELTVDQTLRYAAKIRMSEDVVEEEIDLKINEVLSTLNINLPKLRTNRVSELSGGQRKRVSIAVELLNDPDILFLDEPTSPLDPETIDDFLKCIQQLTQKGTTVIMVTHKPSDLDYVDEVVFLSAGGFMTFRGTPNEMLAYFEKTKIVEIYSDLSDSDKGREWNSKWTKGKITPPRKTDSEPMQLKTESPLRQLFWHSRRYLNIKLNDQGNLLLLLAQPVIIPVLIVFIFGGLKVGVLLLTAISAIWFGVNNACKEIVSEASIYQRERMFNLSIGVYVASKLLVLSLIAFVQVMIFVGILYYSFGTEAISQHEVYGEVQLRGFWPSVLFVFYLSFSATLLGLLMSALFKNTEKVLTLAPIVLIPQILFAGVIARIDTTFKEVVSYFTLGRWGTEGFCRLQDKHTEEMGVFLYENGDTVLASVLHPIAAMQDTTIVQSIDVGRGMKKNIPIETELPTGELVDYPSSAMSSLDIYQEGAMLAMDSFNGNMLGISLLNAVVLIALLITLKRKDSI